MSDPNMTISVPSLEVNDSETPEVVSSENAVNSDSDRGSASAVGGKEVKLSGIKQPGNVTVAGGTRIGRPCNNIPKPAIPRQNSPEGRRSFLERGTSNPIKIESLTRLSDYSNSLKYTYTKTFNHVPSFNGGYYGRVSLRDIGIRQPVVHFDLDYSHCRNAAGFGGGGTMASAYSVRKFSDELSRRRISDLKATDDSALSLHGSRWSSDRKSSSGSVLSDSSRKSSSDDLRRKKSSDGSLSMDSSGDIWKLDSEPRRTSDISVVLTQDTDSFIIGDRVWVGGTKPGQIAYIGETQFAPGEWAGVVLDEPIGKNDGSVANIRYFQCEPKRGIFSRLTRLTRYSLVDGPELAHPKTLPLESARTGDSIALKAVPKKTSPVPTSTASMSRSVFSKPSSPDLSIHPNISIGDRVIVMSSQGSKAGVLRFLGATDFAPGEWCGVELDDPLGKNDGSVAGTRYFECRPKFGLFAPLHKVSKSPASRRPSQASCQIHRGGGSMGIRRQGSKESLASMSSVSSTTPSVRSSARKIGVRTPTTPTSTKNALQEILKEKELHIEQLLKERDLERTEVTRAASQADEAEKRLAAAQQEFEQSKDELEARITDLDAVICLLKSENEELSGLLDEEKKKYEDIQFRFEEVSIDTADLKTTVKNLEDKVSTLERSLADERKRVEVLELESNKLFEAEEQLVIVKDENETLRESLILKEKEHRTLEQDYRAMEVTVSELRTEIESLKINAEASKTSSTKSENDLRDELSKLIKTLEETNLELTKKRTETKELKIELEKKSNELVTREKEKNALLMKEMQEKHKIEVAEINGKFEELLISSDLKLKVLEEKLNDKINVCSELESQMHDCNLKLSQVTSDRCTEESRRREVEERFQKEVAESRESEKKMEIALQKEKETTAEYEKVIHDLKRAVNDSEEKLANVTKSDERKFSALNEVIEAQKNEIETAKKETSIVSNQLNQMKESVDALVAEQNTKLRDLHTTVAEKNSHIEKLTMELEELRKDHELNLHRLKEQYSNDKKEMETKIVEMERLMEEESKRAEGFEKEVSDVRSLLKSKEGELDTERKCRESLMEKLGATEDSHKLLVLEKENLLLEAGDLNRKLLSFEEKLSTALKQKEKLESDLAAFISSSNDSSAQLSKLNGELRMKEKEIDALRDELSKRTAAYERAQQEHKQFLTSKENEFQCKEKSFLEKEGELIKELERVRMNLENVSAQSQAAENDLKITLDGYVKETELKIKGYQDEVDTLRLLEKEKDEKHKQALKELNNALKEHKEKLIQAEDKIAQVEAEKKKNEEQFEAEKDKLKQEHERILMEELKSQKELNDKTQEENLKVKKESDRLQKELRAKAENLQTIAGELEELKKETSKTNDHNEHLQNSVNRLEESARQNEVLKAELETRLSGVESENKILKETLVHIREEKYMIEKNITDKEMLITDLKTKLTTAEEWKKRVEDESERKKKELDEVQEKLCMMVKSFEDQTAERDRCIEGMRVEIKDLKNELEQVKSFSKGEEETVISLKQQIKSRNSEWEKIVEEMEGLKKELKKLEGELATEKKITEDGKKKLIQLEEEKLELRKRVEDQNVALNHNSDLEKRLEDLAKKAKEGEEARETMKRTLVDAEALSRTVEEKESMLQEKENAIRSLLNEVETLKKEKVNLLNNNKVTVETLEKEKTQLQRKIDEMQSGNLYKNNVVDKDENDRQEVEDRAFSQGQVDFLNSVIVDMQKKNDALKTRIEILEMGFSPEDVEDFALDNLKRTAVTLRLYCDICEVFDLHDTEDCPTQAMDQDDQPAPKPSKAKPPPERPYCETCEVFGHDTADCDDAETY